MAADTGRVFISYRRQDTAWPARQLYELLAGRFGAERIFKDVDNIAPGEDFVEKLTSAVAACDVLLALIGPQWLEMRDEQGNRRLDDPDDFVRLELAAALERQVLVVPILVDGAKMPPPAQLPAELAPLTRRQAVEINPVGFNTDRLMATLTELFAQANADPPAPAGPVAARTEPVTPVVPSAVPILPEQRQFAAPAPVAPLPAPPQRPARRGRRWLVPVLAVVGVLAVVAGVLFLPGALRPSAAPGPAPITAVSASTGSTATTPVQSSPSASAAAAFPTIIAHRGGLEVHQFETQQAMEAAAVAGYAIETDVRFTSDGVAVLVHDERASKGLDCGGTDLKVSQTTWAKLRSTCHSKPTQKDPKSYDVPTLDATVEAIAAASDNAWVFAEVKTDQTAAQRKDYLGVFAKYGMTDRLVATSFDRSHLKSIAAADPTIRRMLFVSGKRVPAASLVSDHLFAVAVEQGIATAGYVADLQRAGMLVMIWAPDDESHWAAAVKLKPDMVMTDYPAKYQQWLATR